MRILIAPRDRLDRDAIAPHLPRDRGEIFGRRDHVQPALREERARGNRRNERQEPGFGFHMDPFHQKPLRTGARRAPRWKTETETAIRLRPARRHSWFACIALEAG